MAQPNLPQLGADLVTVGTGLASVGNQVVLLGNMPPVNIGNQLQVLTQMVQQNQQMMLQHQQRNQQDIQALHLTMQQGFLRLEQRVIRNSNCLLLSNAPLEVLPGPGNAPPPAAFPATRENVETMSAPDLQAVLVHYQQPIGGTQAAKQQRLLAFIRG